MAISRRVAVIVAAAAVSAPGVLLAAAACVYILHSLATEAWYRDWFMSYGTTMATLYVAFVAGVIAANPQAMATPTPRPRTRAQASNKDRVTVTSQSTPMTRAPRRAADVVAAAPVRMLATVETTRQPR